MSWDASDKNGKGIERDSASLKCVYGAPYVNDYVIYLFLTS
jgi:hypothetical protein